MENKFFAIVALLVLAAAGTPAPAVAAGDAGAATGSTNAAPPAPGATWGKRYTAGWDMMTRQERKDLGTKLRAVKSYDECKTVTDQARQQMAERAKSKGMAEPAQPKRDGCAAFQK
jgi:hypothetical protein